MENKNMELINEQELMDVNGGGIIDDAAHAIAYVFGANGKISVNALKNNNYHMYSSQYGF